MHVLSKSLALFIFTIYSSTALSESNVALKAFKEHVTIQTIIRENATNSNKLSFDSMSLGGQCGVAGCSWKALVSLNITSFGSNAKTTVHTAIVTGMAPSRTKPIVKFIDLNALELKCSNEIE